MSLLYRLPIILTLLTSACGFSDLKEEAKPAANTPPTAPGVSLGVSRAGDVYKLTLTMASPSTDAEGDPIGYRYTWYRNNELQLLPFAQNEVTEPVATEGGLYEVAWSVSVTPFDNLLDGPSAEAAAVLSLCGPRNHVSGYALSYLDCDNDFQYAAAVTENLQNMDNKDRLTFIRQVFADNITAASGDLAKQERFTNFLDIVFKRIFNESDAVVDFDPETYAYLPVTGAVGPFGQGGYEPLQVTRECIAIPSIMLDAVCLHNYLYDKDNEAGARFFAYNTTQTETWIMQESTANSGEYSIAVTLSSVRFDHVWEPPTDSSLIDSADSSADPAADLSRYLKATGTMTYDSLTLQFRVRVSEATNTQMSADLVALVLDGGATLAMSPGPFCNNNLGTTEITLVEATERPFSTSGLPNYANLISDTETNGNPGVPVDTYYAMLLTGYPALGSNMNGSPGNFSGGGSGAGRDRIGINASPYAYGLSDNANNCRLPADACSSSAVPIQDGGPDAGVACEAENVSNNYDDATYRISSQIFYTGPLLMIGGSPKSEVAKRSLLHFP